MKSYPYAVSCDWFSYSCSCEGSKPLALDQEFTDPVSGKHFYLAETPEHHPYYEQSYLCKCGTAPLAHLFCRCKRPDNPWSCQVKVDNSRLYYARWAEDLASMLRAIGWRVMFVNRIDICCDFNYFANGRSPLSFAQDYLSRPTKSRPSYIRHSSNKLRAVVTRTLHSINYHTLSWGTRDSVVQTNLYDKSLELLEHADKPWIRQRWTEAGLLHGRYGGRDYHVWRVEFSINPTALMVRDKHSGDPVGQLNINNVYTPAALMETWQMLHPRYFTFHALSAEAASRPDVRVRDLPIITLFDRDDAVRYAVKGVQYYRKSTRTDRLLLRRLDEQMQDDNLTSDERQAVNKVRTMLYNLMQLHAADADQANLPGDVLDDYMADCFRAVSHTDQCDRTQQHSYTRRARLWSRILRGSHDRDLEQFVDALRQLEQLSGTEAMEQCLRFANYCAGSAMPDEVISDYVDCEIEAQCLPVSPSALTPPQAADDTHNDNP